MSNTLAELAAMQLVARLNVSVANVEKGLAALKKAAAEKELDPQKVQAAVRNLRDYVHVVCLDSNVRSLQVHDRSEKDDVQLEKTPIEFE